MSLLAYCSGSLHKGPSDTKKLCWTHRERDLLAAGAAPTPITFLNPDDPVASLADPVPLFGRDMFQIQQSDFVVIDARERRGIGIGVEMLAARLFSRPVIAVLPPDSYYRKENVTYRGGTAVHYVHPHLHSLLEAYFGNFSDAGRWIGDQPRSSASPAAPLDVLESAINSYRTELLPLDGPMQAIFGQRERPPR